MNSRGTSILDSVKVNDLIAARGFKRWWLAEKLGVDRVTLARWLSGKISRVRISHVNEMSQLFGVPASELCVNELRPQGGADLWRRTIAGAQVIEEFVDRGRPALAEAVAGLCLTTPNSEKEDLAAIEIQLTRSALCKMAFPEGIKWVDQCISRAKTGSPLLLSRAINLKAQLLCGEGRFKEASQLLETIQNPLPEQEADVLQARALVQTWLGNFTEASQISDQILDLPMVARHFVIGPAYIATRGHMARGDYEFARNTVRDHFEAAKKFGIKRHQVVALAHEAWIAMMTGKIDKAEAALNAAREIFHTLDEMPLPTLITTEALWKIIVEKKDVSAMIEDSGISHVGFRMMFLSEIGKALVKNGHVDAGYHALERAMVLCMETGAHGRIELLQSWMAKQPELQGRSALLSTVSSGVSSSA